MSLGWVSPFRKRAKLIGSEHDLDAVNDEGDAGLRLGAFHLDD